MKTVEMYEQDITLLRELIPNNDEVCEQLHVALNMLALYEEKIANGKIIFLDGD